MAPNGGGLLVYLSGPITAKDGVSVEENVAAALKVFLRCVEAGIPAYCPQLTGAFPSAWSAVTYEQWMAHDFGVIDRCTHVLLLPRWETSAGACREKAYAESIGVPVVESVEALTTMAGKAPPERDVLAKLVTKLETMAPALNGVCVFAAVHSYQYAGPTWDEEMDAARRVLRT